MAKIGSKAKAAAERPVATNKEAEGFATAGTGAEGVEQIYDKLRNAILTQRLLPGTQLKEQALADTFSVNRSVVRQALARLEMRKLVEHFPNRGVFVASPSIEESRDIFSARRFIETAILDVLIGLPGKPDLTSARAIVAQEQEAYGKGQVRQALMLSVDFHRTLAKLAGNRVLAGFLEELLARTPLLMQSFRGFETPRCSLNEHHAILDAIAAGDNPLAHRLMHAHITHLEEKLDLERKEASDDLASLLGLDEARA